MYVFSNTNIFYAEMWDFRVFVQILLDPVADEAKVLEQVIRDTEQISLDEEEEGREGGEGGEEGDKGAPLIEPGSAIAILEEFISRSNLHMVWGSCDCHLIATYRLPNLMNRKFVDEFAVEFCMSMNFKGNRARLARALFNVDKNRCSFWPIVV